MKRIRYVGLALVAMLAMSVTSASAHEFNALGGMTLKATAKQTQVFTTAAGKVECTTVSATGSAALKSLIQVATVTYTGCKAFGLAATVSPAEYEFNADGSVKVLKTITIKAVGCLVTVPAASNTKLETIVYKQAGTEVELEPTVKNITSEGSGAACTYASENKGTYTGKSSVGVTGGTADWN